MDGSITNQMELQLDILRELLNDHVTVLTGHAQRNGVKIIGLMCDIVPVEILASWGFLPLRIPVDVYNARCDSLQRQSLNDTDFSPYCAIIHAKSNCSCASGTGSPMLNRIDFEMPSGYGPSAAAMFDERMRQLARELDVSPTDINDRKSLEAIVTAYNGMRRLIRGICAARNINPAMLSQADLMLIFESARCLPIECVIEPLANILNLFNGNRDISEDEPPRKRILVQSALTIDGTVFDAIERTGLLIAEDDCCNGRREFDLSLNAESENLYDEILLAYTFCPRCPSMRPFTERFDLLYRLIRTIDIDAVVCIKKSHCIAREREADYLRIRLMRLGIDSIVADEKNIVDAVSHYARDLASLPIMRFPEKGES